ncbi:uncharacterized protein C8Q71DRAFT_159973 [Rhodofomes roseus]|uniref:Uncharacterized protein n=1 Tax=Rhodofomes roseus TaxID=34475 RepID=A0ABQ8KA79_9APHY|nr:uncharacterized protein C8Q71DRAFT_159973 [Rhodofomes roseus]KAH9834087.1 hypothetical protein C8Q71DRAFT_159973 [Rhodofomes roseus]
MSRRTRWHYAAWSALCTFSADMSSHMRSPLCSMSRCWTKTSSTRLRSAHHTLLYPPMEHSLTPLEYISYCCTIFSTVLIAYASFAWLRRPSKRTRVRPNYAFSASTRIRRQGPTILEFAARVPPGNGAEPTVVRVFRKSMQTNDVKVKDEGSERTKYDHAITRAEDGAPLDPLHMFALHAAIMDSGPRNSQRAESHPRQKASGSSMIARASLPPPATGRSSSTPPTATRATLRTSSRSSSCAPPSSLPLEHTTSVSHRSEQPTPNYQSTSMTRSTSRQSTPGPKKVTRSTSRQSTPGPKKHVRIMVPTDRDGDLLVLEKRRRVIRDTNSSLFTEWFETESQEPLIAPPQLHPSCNVKIGDLYLNSSDDEVHVWIRTTDGDADEGEPEYWKAITVGYVRDDGRRLTLTATLKVPSWVGKSWGSKRMAAQSR